MATTTESAIRDRIIAVVLSCSPTSHSADGFRAFPNEESARFEDWCESNAMDAWRLVQVVETGDIDPPEVSDTITKLIRATFLISIAYPHSHRAGANALERYRVMEEDQHKIEQAVGMTGRVNFTPPTFPDACWVEGTARRDKGEGCDFLVIEQTMQFYRAV